eukprot:303809_1
MNFICVAVIQFIVLIQQTWCCCISCSNAYNCIGIKDIGNNDQVNFNGYSNRAGTYANISAGGSGRIQCFGSHTTLQSTLSASSHIQVGAPIVHPIQHYQQTQNFGVLQPNHVHSQLFQKQEVLVP